MGQFTPSEVCVTCKTPGSEGGSSASGDEQCWKEMKVPLGALAPLDSIFCLHSHKKPILATKQGAGSSPSRPSVLTYHLHTDGVVTGMPAAF